MCFLLLFSWYASQQKQLTLRQRTKQKPEPSYEKWRFFSSWLLLKQLLRKHIQYRTKWNPLKIYSSTHTQAKHSEGAKTNASPCWSSDEAPEHFLRENHKKWVSKTEGMCQQTPTNNWRQATGKWADSNGYIISKTTHWNLIIMIENVKTCIHDQLYIYIYILSI